MEEIEQINVNKDIGILQLTLSRTKRGLQLQAKAHPSIEEMIRGWGNGAQQDPAAFNRHWNQALTGGHDGDVPPLRVWNLTHNGGMHSAQGGHLYYRLDQVGAPLVLDDEVLNLSWLRLVSISEGEGIKITLKGIHSTEAIKKLGQNIKKAVASLYLEFMRPIDVVINISTRETSGGAL